MDRKLTFKKQATKLLQLKKATLNDIEIIQDICWMYGYLPYPIQSIIPDHKLIKN